MNVFNYPLSLSDGYNLDLGSGGQYRLSLPGNLQGDLYSVHDDSKVSRLDWHGVYIKDTTYKRGWEKSKNYRLKAIYDSGENLFHVFKDIGGGVGLFGVNEIWYISVNGKRIAGLHIRSYRTSLFWGGINCKFFYKTNNLPHGYHAETCIPLLWSILHYLSFYD